LGPWGFLFANFPEIAGFGTVKGILLT